MLYKVGGAEGHCWPDKVPEPGVPEAFMGTVLWDEISEVVQLRLGITIIRPSLLETISLYPWLFLVDLHGVSRTRGRGRVLRYR